MHIFKHVQNLIYVASKPNLTNLSLKYTIDFIKTFCPYTNQQPN